MNHINRVDKMGQYIQEVKPHLSRYGVDNEIAYQFIRQFEPDDLRDFCSMSDIQKEAINMRQFRALEPEAKRLVVKTLRAMWELSMRYAPKVTFAQRGKEIHL